MVAPALSSATLTVYHENVREDAILRLCVLASSSAGNSTFIGTGKTRILIDAGLNRKETFARLAAIGEDPFKLDAIFITHEHSDHVAGLPVIMKKLGGRVPVFLSHLTAPMLDWAGVTPAIELFQAGSRIEFGDLSIRSFTVPHDAVDPVGFNITARGIKISIVTDLGYIPENVKNNIAGSHFLLLESNHQPELLKVGPYPWHVKQRILSRKGHLSNDDAADYISAELPAGVTTLLLGHLSETNNTIWDAEFTARQALEKRRLSPRLIVMQPRLQSEMFHL